MQAQKPQDLDCVSEACNRPPDSESPAREVTPAVTPPTPVPQIPTPADLGGPEPRVFEFDVPPDAWGPVVDGSQPHRILAEAQGVASRFEDVLKQRWGSCSAFDALRDDETDFVVFPDKDELPRGDIWFLGDIHGDLLALECALSHIHRSGAGDVGAIVFLGDLIDDGGMAFEVVVRVLQLMLDMPGRICLLAGNHDEALQYDVADKSFSSSVDPSDFASFLNTHSGDAHIGAIARAYISLVARSPRALFLPDGLVVAHGGVPQRDLWEALTDRRSFNHPLSLQDFVWTRPHPRAPRRIVDRRSRGSEIGRIDFEDFCAHTAAVLSRRVSHMLRGHDHVPERWDAYDNYKKNRILTINTMSRQLAREWDGPIGRWPCVARWVEGQLPDVHRLKIPEDAVRKAYPELDSPGS